MQARACPINFVTTAPTLQRAKAQTATYHMLENTKHNTRWDC